MKNNHPPFPPSILETIGESTSTVHRPEQSNSSTASSASYQSALITYIDRMHNATESRLEDYEKKQEELQNIIYREKIIEESTRRLLQINLVLCILYPTVLVTIFFVFCMYHAPEGVKVFLSEYKIITLSFAVSVICFLAKPMHDIHQYNKRLDTIEKKLKLNGND